MSRRGPRDAILSVIEGQSLLSGRFTSLERIDAGGGEGSFSLLFKAHDRVSQETVALKFYDPQKRADEYRWHSFKREAELLAQFVGQPDILQRVAPLDSFFLRFEHNGFPLDVEFSYYALELAASSAAAAVAFDQWSPVKMLENFRSMCRSVQRIHAARVVHRDIKLSNFLAMADGAVKLCDFGTAKVLGDGETSLSLQYALPVGELTYAAPELFAGLQDVDPRFNLKADIYSLGCVLFEMLTGTPLNPHLFDQGTLADLARTMNAVNRSARIRIYEEFVSALESARPLPPLRYFNIGLPSCAIETVEGLYRRLCAIDYRRRISDFSAIFSYITRALIILNNEADYREWRKRRDLYRKNVELKCLRLRQTARIGVLP